MGTTICILMPSQRWYVPMIKLTKGPKPTILERNAEAWTLELIQKVANKEEISSTLKNRYNHSEIKDALLQETNGKCAYCESKVGHVAHGDIEHIAPKSIHPSLSYEWTNLTYACPKCNNNKRNHEGMVDPYAGEPMAHFFFEGPLLFPMPGDEIAQLTEAKIKLNRSELIEKRKERIQNLHKQIDNLTKTKNKVLKAAIREDILANETAADKEYAALAKHFVTTCFKKLDE